jgi:hypothetical protein
MLADTALFSGAHGAVQFTLSNAKYIDNAFPQNTCREELTQPVFTLMDAFEFPELHDESIYVNNFFRQLCKLMAACGVRDFGWKVCLCVFAACLQLLLVPLHTHQAAALHLWVLWPPLHVSFFHTASF